MNEDQSSILGRNLHRTKHITTALLCGASVNYSFLLKKIKLVEVMIQVISEIGDRILRVKYLGI